MDSTRISIARILDANVPLTWQEAVAVVQEVAMVSDVEAAMNGSPSLVAPETCFLTTAGEVELPEPGTGETPGAVADLLRAVLRGRDAPAALLALTGRRTDDLFDELAPFSTGPRRPVIAALAARALSPPRIAEVPAADAATLPLPPAPRPTPFATAPAAVQTSWPAPRLAHGAAERSRPASVPPPFVASRPAATVTHLATPPLAATSPAVNGDVDAAPSSELELQRLRARTLDSDAQGPRWPTRIAAGLAWRPSFPGPLVIGGGAIVLAAAFVVWRSAPGPNVVMTPKAPAAAASTPAPPAAAEPSAAASGPPTAPAVAPAAASTLSPSSAPRVSAMRPPATSLSAGAAPREAAPVAARPANAGPVAEPGRAVENAPPPSPLVATTPAAGASTPAGGGTRGARIVVSSPDAPRPAARAGRDPIRSRVPFYSATDTNVVPPVMLRQHLPSPLLEPGAELQPGGPYLELLIDESGAVEQVRLRAREPQPGQTWYRHRMLLAAAKAWQFEPARLDQQAVRYLLRVPLEP